MLQDIRHEIKKNSLSILVFCHIVDSVAQIKKDVCYFVIYRYNGGK